MSLLLLDTVLMCPGFRLRVPADALAVRIGHKPAEHWRILDAEAGKSGLTMVFGPHHRPRLHKKLVMIPVAPTSRSRLI